MRLSSRFLVLTVLVSIPGSYLEASTPSATPTHLPTPTPGSPIPTLCPTGTCPPGYCFDGQNWCNYTCVLCQENATPTPSPTPTCGYYPLYVQATPLKVTPEILQPSITLDYGAYAFGTPGGTLTGTLPPLSWGWVNQKYTKTLVQTVGLGSTTLQHWDAGCGDGTLSGSYYWNPGTSVPAGDYQISESFLLTLPFDVQNQWTGGNSLTWNYQPICPTGTPCYPGACVVTYSWCNSECVSCAGTMTPTPTPSPSPRPSVTPTPSPSPTKPFTPTPIHEGLAIRLNKTAFHEGDTMDVQASFTLVGATAVSGTAYVGVNLDGTWYFWPFFTVDTVGLPVTFRESVGWTSIQSLYFPFPLASSSGEWAAVMVEHNGQTYGEVSLAPFTLGP